MSNPFVFHLTCTYEYWYCVISLWLFVLMQLRHVLTFSLSFAAHISHWTHVIIKMLAICTYVLFSFIFSCMDDFWERQWLYGNLVVIGVIRVGLFSFSLFFNTILIWLNMKQVIFFYERFIFTTATVDKKCRRNRHNSSTRALFLQLSQLKWRNLWNFL